MGETLKEDIITLAERKLRTYGAEVVEQRAVPDFRDGLKPVHRFILWACYGLGLHHDKAFKKAARTVGETIGKYSPHGDGPTYEAMVKIAGTKADDGKTWVTRNISVPLIEGYGNWGDNIDNAAAMRYTEARLSLFADLYLLDPVYLAVSDYHQNFSGDDKVPYVLPAKLPAMLLNGSVSIAFGISAETPPFHPTGVIDLVRMCLQGKEITPKLCVSKLKFNPPFGGICVSDGPELESFFKTGAGSVSFSPEFSIDARTKTIVITSACPELVSRNSFDKLIEKLGQLQPVRSVYDATDKVSFRIEVQPVRGLSEEDFQQLSQTVKDICIRRSSFDMGITERTEKGVSFRRTNVPQFIRDWCKWRVELEIKVVKYLISEEERKLVRQDLLLLAASNLEILFKALKQRDSESYLVKYLGVSPDQAREIMGLNLRQLKSMELANIRKAIIELKSKIKQLKTDLKAPSNRIIATLDSFDPKKHTY